PELEGSQPFRVSQILSLLFLPHSFRRVCSILSFPRTKSKSTSTAAPPPPPPGGPSEADADDRLSPIDLFFTRYPAYHHDRSALVHMEFKRLARVYQWRPVSAVHGALFGARRKEFADAV